MASVKRKMPERRRMQAAKNSLTSIISTVSCNLPFESPPEPLIPQELQKFHWRWYSAQKKATRIDCFLLLFFGKIKIKKSVSFPASTCFHSPTQYPPIQTFLTPGVDPERAPICPVEGPHSVWSQHPSLIFSAMKNRGSWGRLWNPC